MLETPVDAWAVMHYGTLSVIPHVAMASGSPAEVYAREYSWHICHASFREQPGLKRHLGDVHTYRIVCSCCDEFGSLPGYNHLF
jgi:hypothetical protein